MIGDKAGTVTEQQVLSDHFIRLGRHTGLLNDNVKSVESAILNNQNQFVNGDWTSQIAALQKTLNGMGYKGKLQNPTAAKRAATLAKIKQHGLKGYLAIIGAAAEQQGANFVSPYSMYHDPAGIYHARLVPAILPVCGVWLDIAGDLFAVGAIAALAGQEELGLMFGGAGGILWLYGRYLC